MDLYQKQLLIHVPVIHVRMEQNALQQVVQPIHVNVPMDTRALIVIKVCLNRIVAEYNRSTFFVCFC